MFESKITVWVKKIIEIGWWVYGTCCFGGITEVLLYAERSG
jgi:hypothetical protein